MIESACILLYQHVLSYVPEVCFIKKSYISSKFLISKFIKYFPLCMQFNYLKMCIIYCYLCF